MIIVIDGPNKAGKSTLINNVDKNLSALGYTVRIRHWGPLVVDDREYSPYLQEDTNPAIVTIWDRSWVSEHVYGQLLKRSHRRLTEDPWLGEFLHRRALFGQGKGFILAPSNGLNMQYLDTTDEIYSDDPAAETRLFMQYALRFKWYGMVNKYTDASLKSNTKTIVNFVTEHSTRTDQRLIVGYNTSMLIVGSSQIDDPFPGGWLPFGSLRLIEFARLFGDAGLAATWASPEYLSKAYLGLYSKVLCVGNVAFEIVRKLDPNKKVDLVYVPTIGRTYTHQTARERLIEMGNEYPISSIRQYLSGVWNASTYI